MTSAFHRLFKRMIGAAITLSLSFCLIFAPFGNLAEASRASMSGDYLNDTLSVAQSLHNSMETAQDAESKSEVVALITDYISRYRNRSQINTTSTFTTMQPALNSLSGHYKTFSNRPVPENLKERLNEELSKAEKMVLENS